MLEIVGGEHTTSVKAVASASQISLKHGSKGPVGRDTLPRAAASVAINDRLSMSIHFAVSKTIA